MYLWNEEKTNFMRTAAENSDYYRQIANYVQTFAADAVHICDAGCGLGYLTLELAKHYPKVTAVDLQPVVLQVLRENLQKRQTENVTVLEGDILQHPPREQYDAMVFCFYGDLHEILQIARKQCKGKVIAVFRNWQGHRFSPAPQNDQPGWGYENSVEELKRLKIPFSAHPMELEMGQPFHTKQEAERFFRLYGRDDVGVQQGLSGLQPREGEFAWYLPVKKPIGILEWSVQDMPAMLE